MDVQVLANVKVEHMHDVQSVPGIRVAIKAAEKKLDGTGRILVRPSGTERKIRVMIEGKDLRLITKLSRDIAKVIKEKMT